MSSVAHAASAASAPSRAGAMQAPTGPWWRHPMMWLVVGGPSVVVVASVITLVLAVRHADPVVDHGAAAGSAHVSADDADSAAPALAPAMKARNHAATAGQEH